MEPVSSLILAAWLRILRVAALVLAVTTWVIALLPLSRIAWEPIREMVQLAIPTHVLLREPVVFRKRVLNLGFAFIVPKESLKLIVLGQEEPTVEMDHFALMSAQPQQEDVVDILVAPPFAVLEDRPAFVAVELQTLAVRALGQQTCVAPEARGKHVVEEI